MMVSQSSSRPTRHQNVPMLTRLDTWEVGKLSLRGNQPIYWRLTTWQDWMSYSIAWVQQQLARSHRGRFSIKISPTGMQFEKLEFLAEFVTKQCTIDLHMWVCWISRWRSWFTGRIWELITSFSATTNTMASGKKCYATNSTIEVK